MIDDLLFYAILVYQKYEYITKIKKAWFLDDISSQLWDIVNTCISENDNINIEIVKEHVFKQELKEIHKKSLMNRLIKIDKMETYPPENLDKILRDNYINNNLNNFVTKVKDTAIPVNTKMDILAKLYNLINDNTVNTTIHSMNDIIHDYISKIEKGENTRFLDRSIKLESEWACEVFSNTLRPVLNVIAGLSGYNKTGLVLNLVNEFNMLGKKGLLFSFEDPKDVWCNKYLSIRGSIDLSNTMDNKLSQDKIKIIKNFKTNIWITDNAYNIVEFRNEIDRQMSIREYDYMVIDYLELFRYNHSDEPRQLKLICNELRRISTRYLLPILLVSQLNRDKYDNNSEVIPNIRDLYGSSAIEKAARRVILIGGVKNDIYRKIHIAKSSYSAMYKFALEFNQATGKIKGIVNE